MGENRLDQKPRWYCGESSAGRKQHILAPGRDLQAAESDRAPSRLEETMQMCLFLNLTLSSAGVNWTLPPHRLVGAERHGQLAWGASRLDVWIADEGYKFIALKHNKVQIFFALKHFQ